MPSRRLHTGKVGLDYTTEQAAELAQRIGLILMATLRGHVGDLDKITRIVKVRPRMPRDRAPRRHAAAPAAQIVGFVNCVDDFTQQPEVINGCSDLLGKVFGKERGTHARSAVGTNSLPRNVPVEIEMIAEIAP